MRLAPRINRAVHDLIARYGGSISAEHGIGQLKREELLRYKHPVAIERHARDQAGARPERHHESRARCSD